MPVSDERATYVVYPMKAGRPDPAKVLQLVEYFLCKNKNSTITWDGKQIDGIDGDIVSINSFAIVKDLRKMRIAVEEELNTPWVSVPLAGDAVRAPNKASPRAETVGEIKELGHEPFDDCWPGYEEQFVTIQRTIGSLTGEV